MVSLSSEDLGRASLSIERLDDEFGYCNRERKWLMDLLRSYFVGSHYFEYHSFSVSIMFGLNFDQLVCLLTDIFIESFRSTIPLNNLSLLLQFMRLD